MSHSNLDLSEVLKKTGSDFVTSPIMHHIGSIEYTEASILRQVIYLNEGEERDNSPVSIVGTMRAGKTTTVVDLANKIAQANYTTYFYSLVDNRGIHYNRNGLNLVDSVIKDRVEINSNPLTMFIDQINSGEIQANSVLFLSEIQFANDFSEKLDGLIEVAERNGIKIIFDCLYRFFRGDQVPGTQKLVRDISNIKTYELVTVDCFDPNKEAQLPARFLRFYEDGTSINGDINHSQFYKGLTPDQIILMIKRIKTILY